MRMTILIVMLACLTQGCAASMAAQGQNGPDINVVKRQETRADMERMLGLPVETLQTSGDEIVELYTVEARTEPSAARAAGHATADLFTFGLWEFVGGPIEGYKGRRQRVVVTYNENDEVLAVMTQRNNSDAAVSFK